MNAFGVRLHLVQAVAEAVDYFLAVVSNLAYINALEQFLQSLYA